MFLAEGLGDIWARIKKITKNAKISLKKFGKKVFAFYSKGPKREQGVIDPSSGKIAIKWIKKSKKHACVMINPKVYRGKKNVKTNESTFLYYDQYIRYLNEIMSPDEAVADAEKEIGTLGKAIQDVEDPSDRDMFRTGTAEPASVDFSDLDEILENVAYGLKYRKKYTEDVPSILLMGPPGGGKTSVVKQFAKRRKMNMKIMEIASLYKEMLGGFPVIEQVLKDGIDPSTLSPEERKSLSDELKQSVVKVKQADLLPPSGDTKPWILFLDEFNRDSEKMAAAMNLILTGNIGDAYYLPLKTIVIAAGNLGKDIDGVDVAQFDSATWDRFNKKVQLNYDRSASVKHAEKENTLDDDGEEDFTPPNVKKSDADTIDNDGEKGIDYFTKRAKGIKVSDKMVSSLYNYNFRKTKETGNNSWQVDLAQFNPEADAKLTPRTFNKIDKDLKIKAVKDWDEDNLVGTHDKKWYEERYEAKGFKSPVTYYLHVNQWKEPFLPKHLTQSLGPTGGALAQDMLAAHAESKKELDLSPQDIVFNWTAIRNKNGNKEKANNYIGQVNLEGANSIVSLKSMASLKKAVDSKKPGKKLLADFDNDYAMYVATNIHNYYKASGQDDGNVEEVTAFLDQLAQSDAYQSFLKEDDKSKFEKIPVVAIISNLLDASSIFQEAWENIADNISADEDVKDKANSFAAKNMFINGTAVPEWFAKSTPDKLRKKAIATSSMLYSGAKLKKDKPKSKRKMTDESLNESLRNIFKKV
jgi:hypothetical protein